MSHTVGSEPVGVLALLQDLQRERLTIAAAESCTGGLLAAGLTDHPGSSTTFLGGVVAYSNDAKHGLLGVDLDLLERTGAVSGAAVEAMAHGLRARLGADVNVAISGIAGPTGAVPGKPVGTVWIAVLGPGDLLDVRRVHLDGDRETVRRAAVLEAVAMAREAVAEADAEGLTD